MQISSASVILENCINTSRIHGQITESTYEMLRTAEIRMSTFGQGHIWSIQKSTYIGIEPKQNIITYINGFLLEFTLSLCRLCENKNEPILESLEALEKSIKTKIIIDAMRARASFIDPIVPFIKVISDCPKATKKNPQPKFCTKEDTIRILVMKTRNAELDVQLKDVWEIVDRSATDDFIEQINFMAQVVMPHVIETADFLPIGEKLFHRALVDSKVLRDSIVDRMVAWKEEKRSVFGTLMQTQVFVNGKALLESVKMLYMQVKWREKGQSVFDLFENVRKLVL